MATFIFLHGSFHAAWNWHKVTPLLEQAGHHTIALDLPGHGLDHTPARRVTLASCVDVLVRCMDKQTGPVILVAHSRNGIVISQAAERRPDRTQGLVYLAAYLIPNGKSMMEYAIRDVESLVLRNVETSLNRTHLPLLIQAFGRECLQRLGARVLPTSLQVHRLKRSAYREALYHDCTDDIIALAEATLQSEPNWAGFSRLRLSPARYGRVPRVYIECLQDRAVTLSLQRSMVAETCCDRVFSLDTGHSPFFSQPEKLAGVLVESVGTFASTPRRGAVSWS